MSDLILSLHEIVILNHWYKMELKLRTNVSFTTHIQNQTCIWTDISQRNMLFQPCIKLKTIAYKW